MSHSTDCPEPFVLQHFIRTESLPDSLLPWTRELLERHLDQCHSCQESLERLVAGQQSWEGAANLLAGIEAGSIDSSVETEALRQLMEAQKERVPDLLRETISPMDAPNPGKTPLDFLQPSDQPDSRGRLGTYEILDIVGRGGMGVVLKAYDPSLRRIVAIKVMASHLASSPVAKKRFVREARAAAAVSHDHVVAIYGVEENQDPPFLVMQFISGKTLQERLSAVGSLSVNEVLRIGMQVAAGLAAAHSQGLVHRDIKPANILLENGVERVKITDFGLARAINDAGMTQTGIVAGTPQFMAPEQANGEQIDLRSDLFSLGSVLYMLCTGRPPFRATTVMGLLKRICEEPPKPLLELNPEIPDWLDAIVMKLLSKRPADRYQSAKEVADLLEQWLAHIQRPLSIPRPSVALANGNPTAPVQKTVTEAMAHPVSDQQSPVAVAIPEAVNRTSAGIWSDYSRTAPLVGNPEKAFDLATATLAGAGFKLTESSDCRLSFAGPGLVQVRQNTLTQASSLELTYESGQLTLAAKLGTMRKRHRNLLLIPLIFGVVVAVFGYRGFSQFELITGNILIPVLLIPFFAILVGTSIFQGQKIVRRTLDTFFENLIHSEPFSRSVEIISPTPKPQWYEQVQRSWRETFSNRIYGTTALIWASWIIFLVDSSPRAIPFIHWLAIATLCLGIGWPAVLVTFAWIQKLRLGKWDGTLLPHGPRHFLLRPFMFLFLFGASYWGWQQVTCGTIIFDIDDREFTVALMGPSLSSSQSFSADFPPMRVRAGKYNWGIRHSRDLIATGQFEVEPFQQNTIRFRSPYPIGQADIKCLPGRWDISVGYLGSYAFTTKSQVTSEIEPSAKNLEFIDVTEHELRVHSSRVVSLLNSFTAQENRQLTNLPESAVYRFRTTRPQDGSRGPTWIDLLGQNSKTLEDTVVAHGIFAADRKYLSIQLQPASDPRPTWGSPHDNSSLMLQFERASDQTLLQGTWMMEPDATAAPETPAAPPRLRPTRITFTGDRFEIHYAVQMGENHETPMTRNGSFELSPQSTPKRITLSDGPRDGVIRVSAGLFRFNDGDNLTLQISGDEKFPPDFESQPEKYQLLTLTRAKD